ncbi:MAG: ABC transporter substrate-binding protein [Candidatus Rokubacteria bacterium]|nr:ABC transporter substrate-binding protein [Candidatus Rokubacteria bacterium]
MSARASIVAAVALAASLGAATPASADHEIVIGVQCDRSGPDATVGAPLCAGFRDYVALVNAGNGVEGHRIRAAEIDTESRVPPALAAYERLRGEAAVALALYGTQIYALAPRLAEDRIVATAAGWGPADAANGRRHPYVFSVASAASQAAAAVGFAKHRLGTLKGKKVAFVPDDSPAGREPIAVLEDLAERERFQLKTFAAPSTGATMATLAVDLARRYRADFVIAHLAGRAPSLAIQELARVGYPLDKVIFFVGGSAEADVDAAGGRAVADGYHGLEFAGVGQEFPVLRAIQAMYHAQGRQPPTRMASSVCYNRGVVMAALQVQAIGNAVAARPDGRIIGDDVKAGMEKIRGFTLGGLTPPLEITPTDHEGGGRLQVWQVKGARFVPVTDWFTAYPRVIARHVTAERGAPSR